MNNIATYLKDAAPSLTMNYDVPKVVLAVGAHPDDIEFGCGGTLAKWAALGARVVTLILTDGSKGTWDANADPQELAQLRKIEATNSLFALANSTSVRFLEAIDGELTHSPENVAQVAQLIRAHKPDIVLGHDPWKRYRIHPDHRNAGWILCDAIAAARDPLYFPQDKHGAFRPGALLLFEAQDVDHVEVIEETLDRKLQALLCHVSQLETSMGISSPKDAQGIAEFRERLRRRHHDIGARYGVGPSEEFKLLVDL